MEGYQNYAYPIPSSFALFAFACIFAWSGIERGFSVNKDIATANRKEETIVAYQKVYDGVKQRQCSVH